MIEEVIKNINFRKNEQLPEKEDEEVVYCTFFPKEMKDLKVSNVQKCFKIDRFTIAIFTFFLLDKQTISVER